MAARGGLLRLLDAYIAIGGDTSGYDAALTQAEAKAKASGDRISGLFTPSKVFAALATAAGAAFGMALTGANQLDAATRRLQADTGMTAAEAAKAEHALAGMYRNNLQGFDAIGAAMAKVHNDLGLTGAEADATTEKFLKFSTATGIDAAEAVTLLDDALDNWGLTAADSQMVMDKVIVSHQKWGGEIDKNLVTLAKVAPAMRAANFSIDDGIALLGLFGAKGLDSERAAAAFAKALTKVKSPAELQALITDISNTADPFARAAKAADLFGAKAGAQLANALGGVAISDFTVSVTEAAGATDRAAEASLSWGDKMTLVLHNIGGALADFGTNFGPLLMLASVVGPKMLATIAAGLGGAGALLIPKITGPLLGAAGIEAWMTTGTKIGTLVGASIGPAMAVAAAAAVLLVWDSINKDLNKQADALTSQTAEWAKTATLVQLQAQREAIGKGAMDIANTPFGSSLWGDQLASLKTQLDLVNAAIAKEEDQLYHDSRAVGETVPDGITDGIDQGAPKALATMLAFVKTVGGAFADGLANMPVPVDKLVATFGTSWAGVNAAAKNLGHANGVEGMLAMAAGVEAARKAPLDAFTTLVEMLKHQLTPMAEEARLAGQLTSKELARGLRSKDPEVRAQAIAVKQAILDRLAVLAHESGPLGKKAMDELNAGIKSKDPEIRHAAQQAKDAVIAQLEKTKTGAYTAGGHAGTAFGDGFTTSLRRTLTGIGINIGVGGIGGQASGGPYSAGQVNWVGEQGPELRVATLPGYTLTHQEAVTIASGAQGVGHGGDTFSPTVNVSVSAGSDVSPGAARRFGQAIADEVANVLQEQNSRFTSRLRVARA